MFTTPLERKLLRDLWRVKGQILTIAIVLASGVASFVMLRGTSDCLEVSRHAYYDRYRFAHVFATLERAPETLSRRIEQLPGVHSVETRIAEDVTLPIEGMQQPASARLLAVPGAREPHTNSLHLQKGHYPKRGAGDEVVVLASFADAHGLEPGHSLPAVINGKLRQLRVVGVALSPEFVFAIRPGALARDPRGYAVLWMERRTLASAFQLEGSFNEVSLRLQPGASESEVLSRLDTLLEPYGGNGSYGRIGQSSHRILDGELGTLAGLAAMVPLVFLAVVAFLVRLVLGRLISLQRGEIATLKAIGYSNREVGWHFLGLVGVVIVPGSVLGLVLGRVLGEQVLQIYASIFRFPDITFRLTPSLVAWGVLAGVVGAGSGALLAIRSAVELPPAEAMRPPAPTSYRRRAFERLGIAALLGPSGMMVLRESVRRPLRTLMSATGIGGAVSLLILGRFGWDSMMNYFDGTFVREQRQDITVTFARPTNPRAVGEIRRLPGVIKAEGLRAVPVRARSDQVFRDTLLMGIPPTSTLRRLVEQGGEAKALPADGILVTRKLGEILRVRPGDQLQLEVHEGSRLRIRPVVAGLVDEANGLFIYARSDRVASLTHDLGTVSAVLLSVDPKHSDSIQRELQRSPLVLDVSEIRVDMQRLLDQQSAAFDVWTFVSVLLASSVIFGVVYNNARIALTARSRDLATLRVLGFSRREISQVLLGSLAVELALAIPIGLALGYAWARQFVQGFDQETFRLVAVVAPRTYLLASLVTLLAATASALWVRRDLDRLDLIAVLKTRE